MRDDRDVVENVDRRPRFSIQNRRHGDEFIFILTTVDPEQIVDKVKGFRARRLDLGVAETPCFDGEFLVVSIGYNTTFSFSAGWGWESRRMRNEWVFLG
jgi:hypothetical protein